MPCPHCKVTIIKRCKNESAVSAAAYQSGEKLFSEYDQEQKYYPYKNEVTHKKILLPPHAPPEFADRGTLWNSAEAQEKQWNFQLARRFVLAIPREIPRSQHADLIRDYRREFFVSKGMIADFAIHDKGDGNPHAHILLTMRAMDENGQWLPKSRKVYDLDGNGERIRLPFGRWKSHKENTVDWNDQKYAEIWRQGWVDTANRYLEVGGRPERLDHNTRRRTPPMNEKLEKLNQEIEKTEARLRRAQHKEKMLEHQIKTLNRKERTHRLCTRGAMLESHLPHPGSVTDGQVSTILKVLFCRSDTNRLVEQVLAENRKEDAEWNFQKVNWTSSINMPHRPRRKPLRA